MRLTKGWLATIIIAVIILADQILKIWVKTNFYYGEEYVITDWFRLNFIENNGMAFGFEFGSKPVLTWFRIIVSALFLYYVFKLTRRSSVNTGYLTCVCLITAGAIGNMIDCVFYGVIFNDPMIPQTATMFPPEGGYASLFNGRVVDMFYFPLVDWYWPEWMPFVGGEYFVFFQPVFNVADASLSVGVIILIFFFSKHLNFEDVGKLATSDEVTKNKA